MSVALKIYFVLILSIKWLNFEAISVPVIKRPVQVAKIDLLSAATLGWLTAKRVAQVMIFMGTRNQLVTVAR